MTMNTSLVPYVPQTIGLVDSRGVERWNFPVPRTSLDRLPYGTQVPQSGGGLLSIVNQRHGYVFRTNAATYRAWSEASPWVRAAIDIRRDQVSSADWDIVPYDKDGYGDNKRVAKRVKALLESPNADDTFFSYVQKVVEDILVLDGAPTEKVRYPTGEIAELYPVAGEFIALNSRWDGSDEDQIRYLYVPDGTIRAQFTNADMVYFMQNPRTNSVVGLPPLEVLKQTVDAELKSMEYNRRMVVGSPPEGVLDIGELATPPDVSAAKSEWESNILGQSAFAVIGGYKNPQWIKFRDTNQEMQFREWQDYLVRQIAVVFALSPQDLGITFDVNRTSSETQSENTDDRGLKPLLQLIQERITQEVVWDESFGGKANNLRFAFTALNLKESLARANINKISMGGSSWKTVNEARVMEGRAPLGDPSDEKNIFNCITSLTPKGFLNVSAGTYVGEADLAKIAADAQMDVEQVKGEVRAANPTATQPVDTAVKRD
jgi:HK97 family phage portal protein